MQPLSFLERIGPLSRSPYVGTVSSEQPLTENSARSNFRNLIATLTLPTLVVHLLKPVVALIVTPIDEDGSMIDTGAILAPLFETYMGGGKGGD